MKDKLEGKSKPILKRGYKHEVSRRGLAASTILQVRSVLNRTQLLQCADAYVNNGIVRTVLDKSVFFINGERSNFLVELNDEVKEGSTEQEIRDLEQQINDDTLEVNGKPANIKDLRRKLVRVNKRVKLQDRIDKLINSALIFGRGVLEIIRYPTDVDYPIFGEPLALRHLNSIRISNVDVNRTTGGLDGIFYDEGTGSGLTETKRYISSDKIIPAFHDDNNLYDNTNYSGLSAVWPILSVSQADDVINDEDIPEITRNLGAKFGFIYPGSSAQSDIDDTRDQLAQGTWLVTGKPEFRAQVEDLGRDPMELPNVRLADAKYITMCMNLPLFLLFEDTANFATANQVMQVYKAGMLKRYRTWLQGYMEDYWYAPQVADHFNIELKDVISLPINIKWIAPDINFETRKDVIDADKILVDMGVFKPSDVAKDIDRKDIVQRIEEEQVAKDQQRQDAINQTLVSQKGQIAFLQQQNALTQQQNQIKQQPI